MLFRIVYPVSKRQWKDPCELMHPNAQGELTAHSSTSEKLIMLLPQTENYKLFYDITVVYHKLNEMPKK